MRATTIITALALALWLTPARAAMEIHNHAEEEEGIWNESDSITDDYLFMGPALNFSGKAQDLIFLGQTLTFSGETSLGLMAGCEKLVYTGKTGNGLMAGCMDVAIDGQIEGTTYVGSKSLHFTKKSSLKGNLFAGCGKLTIDGPITGDVYAGAGEIVINNIIDGNVTAYSGRIIFGEKGRITGNLTYKAKEKLSGVESSRVAGSVVVKENGKEEKEWGGMSAAARFLISMGFFLSFFVVGLLLLFLPVFKKLDRDVPEKAFWHTGLWGLIPMLMLPAIIILSFVLVLTIPLGAVLLLAAFPLFYVAYVIGATLVGKYIATKFNWKKLDKRHYQFLVGALVVQLLGLIPFVNFLVFIFVAALGWGVYLAIVFDRESATA